VHHHPQLLGVELGGIVDAVARLASGRSTGPSVMAGSGHRAGSGRRRQRR
jgi:hypothetical protein